MCRPKNENSLNWKRQVLLTIYQNNIFACSFKIRKVRSFKFEKQFSFRWKFEAIMDDKLALSQTESFSIFYSGLLTILIDKITKSKTNIICFSAFWISVYVLLNINLNNNNEKNCNISIISNAFYGDCNDNIPSRSFIFTCFFLCIH